MTSLAAAAYHCQLLATVYSSSLYTIFCSSFQCYDNIMIINENTQNEHEVNDHQFCLFYILQLLQLITLPSISTHHLLPCQAQSLSRNLSPPLILTPPLPASPFLHVAHSPGVSLVSTETVAGVGALALTCDDKDCTSVMVCYSTPSPCL